MRLQQGRGEDFLTANASRSRAVRLQLHNGSEKLGERPLVHPWLFTPVGFLQVLQKSVRFFNSSTMGLQRGLTKPVRQRDTVDHGAGLHVAPVRGAGAA